MESVHNALDRELWLKGFSAPTPSHALPLMAPKLVHLTCFRCGTTKPRQEFALRQQRRRQPVCLECSGGAAVAVAALTCTRCDVTKPHDQFAAWQRARSDRVCSACTSSAHARSGLSRAISVVACGRCGTTLPRESFGVNQRLRAAPVCRDCTSATITHAISVADMRPPCTFCGAVLFTKEPTSFCCQGGRYAVDFSSYFREPAPFGAAHSQLHGPANNPMATTFWIQRRGSLC